MDINDFVGYLTTGITTIIVGYFGIKKQNHQTEVKNELLHAELKNQIQILKSENKELKSRIAKLEERDEKLNNIEKILIKLEKDIEYIKKDKRWIGNT